MLLSAALRAELVRHVDDCPRCRRAAERVGAAGPWPNATALPEDRLPLVEAPRAAAYMAMLHVPRARAGAPRFAPTGFPMDPKDHVARRDRMRARAVTTTVVAAVVAAPVLALWTSYRGTPTADTAGHGGARISAREADEPVGPDGDRYENAGNARTTPEPRFTQGSRAPDVSVEVVSPGGPTGPARPGEPAAGWITVAATGRGDLTLLTLTASGGSPVDWSLWTDAPWLYVSRASGTLRPGEKITVAVRVDHAREPVGSWSARLGVNPSGAVVRIAGHRPPTDDRAITPPPVTTTQPTTPPTSPPTTEPTTPPTSPPTTEPTTPPTTEPTTPPPTTEPTTEPTTPPPTTEDPPPTTSDPGTPPPSTEDPPPSP